MAFHLRKITKNNDTYLYIYETYRTNNSANPKQKHYKTLGYLNKLKKDGIEDPISYALDEVKKLNTNQKIKKEIDKAKQITSDGVMYFGNFMINKLIKKLNYSNIINLFNHDKKININPSDLLNDLAIARIISPASKNKTYHEILKNIIGLNYESNIRNLYEGLSFLGFYYKEIIQVLNQSIKQKFKRNTNNIFFDCTNFYFEISKEDDIRRKGPSKENKKSPLVSMGLMLDNDLIPIGMHIFPGNESEKPQLKKVINEMKNNENIKGKTILVADKGLNCAKNIILATNQGDGFIFSKSVKSLKQDKIEKLINHLEIYQTSNNKKEFSGSFYEEIVDTIYSYKDENNNLISKIIKEKHIYFWSESYSKKQKIEIDQKLQKAMNIDFSTYKKNTVSGASQYIKKSNNNKIEFEVDYEKANRDRLISGMTLIITSEINADSNSICKKYSSKLWRIEESFKILKSELDTRPIFHQKEDNIKGHLLVCYLALTLLRLLEFKEFNSYYSSSQIVEMIRKFKCFKMGNQYLNLTSKANFIDFFNEHYNVNLNLLYIKSTTMKKIFS